MEYTRITPTGEEKCSLLDGDGMTVEEMDNAIRNFCDDWGSCVHGKEVPCPLRYGIPESQSCFGEDADIVRNYNILVNAGLVNPPVNFTKANPDDAVESEGDAVEGRTRYEKHRAICEKLNDIYHKKNTDYGNSFGIGFAEYGLIMPVIRLEDKFQRFKRLALGGEQNVADESIKDTLLDLANYAIMTLVEMEASK